MDVGHDQLMPCARTDGLVVQTLPDEVLVYDLERHRAHALNHTAALIWKSCNGQTSLAEMVHIRGQEMKTAVPEAVVWLALQQLARACLLEERIHPPGGRDSMSRRDVMCRLGWGAAVALPLVTSIVAPTAVEAATCLPGGFPCTFDSQCCSGDCAGLCTAT